MKTASLKSPAVAREMAGLIRKGKQKKGRYGDNGWQDDGTEGRRKPSAQGHDRRGDVSGVAEYFDNGHWKIDSYNDGIGHLACSGYELSEVEVGTGRKFPPELFGQAAPADVGRLRLGCRLAN